MKELVKISSKQIASKGVQSLADRPNSNAQYGVGGLSSTQLKLWFDKLASFLAEKINELQTTLASNEAADYIRLTLDDLGVGSLKDLVDSFRNGDFANKILRLNPSASITTTQTLQAIINDIARAIADISEGIDEKLDANGAAWNEKGLVAPEGKSFIVRSSIPAEEDDPEAEISTQLTDAGIRVRATMLGKDYTWNYTVDLDENVSVDSEGNEKLVSADRTLVTQSYLSKTYVKKSEQAPVYRFKGSKQKYSDLPEKRGGSWIVDPLPGDVYNVVEPYEGYPAGTNFAATYTNAIYEQGFLIEGDLVWDALGGIADLSNYFTKDEINDIIATLGESGTKVTVGGEVVKEFDADTKLNKIEYSKDNTITPGTDGGVIGRVYVVDRHGNQNSLPLRSDAPIQYAIPFYNGGNFYVTDASIGVHCVNLHTMEKHLEPLQLSSADHEKRIENLEGTLLTRIDDTSEAYEKAVPVGVAPNAILDSIGGASVTSQNHFNPNGRGYNVNADGSMQVYTDFDPTVIPSHLYLTQELEAGTYYLSGRFEDTGNDSGCSISFEDYTNSITLEAKSTVRVMFEFDSSVNLNNRGDGLLDGKAYIMLSKDEALPFEPYFEGIRHAPVTAVKSYGSNLFNPQWLIDYVSEADKGKISFGAINGLKVSKYPIVTDITFAKFLELTGLKVGDTFSAKHKVYLDDGSVAPQGTYNITFEAGGDGTWLDIFTQYGKTITITEDMLKWQKLSVYMMDASNAPRYIKDIMLVKGDVLADYEPYSTEPIDIYTIPSVIQSQQGYGDFSSFLDFEKKTFRNDDSGLVDVSEYLADYDKYKTLKVQGGGRIVFENEHKIAVPSMLSYVKRKE